MSANEDVASGSLPDDSIVVRELEAGDLDRVVRIDKASTGLSRRGYYEKRITEALGAGIRVSLAAEVDSAVVGFVLGRVYHGEYGQMDPFATIDSIGVAAEFRGRGIGQAMMEQLVRNLKGLRVERVQTEVDWDQSELLSFLKRSGFRPVPRLCLELAV